MPYSDYKKVREIGKGSFGHAYLVQNGDSKCVLKEVDMSKMGSRERQSAEGEVRVLSKLKHPYIVRYFESFVHHNKLCIVMDYCDGGDLWKYIERRKRQEVKIPEAQVLRWFTQMCLATKYMHDDKHVLHRDIKPQNIFLVPKEGGPLGSVKIADFGISKVLAGENAVARTQCGTPYYLSPEMCQQRPYSCPSDIWALGCVLYQLCAKKVPFEAQSINQLKDRISRGPLPAPPAGYSSVVGGLVQALLDRTVQRRPSAAALLQEAPLQQEIKAMYAQNKQSREDAGEAGRGRDEKQQGQQLLLPPTTQADARVRSPSPSPVTREPLRELNNGARVVRSPSPVASVVKKGGVRDPSPLGQRPRSGIAREVLRPTRAASPRVVQKSVPPLLCVVNGSPFPVTSLEHVYL